MVRSLWLRAPRVAVLSMAVAFGCASPPAVPVEERLYRLPFEAGTTRWVAQTGPVPFMHDGRQRHAIDFVMPVGTPILAARAGRVVKTKSDGRRVGITKGFAKHGNYVRVLHEDGTLARYLHLRTDGVAVSVGERVAQGQLLGWSGDTGRSFMAHLHFDVKRRDPKTKSWSTIPVSFADVPGDGRVRYGRRYTSGNGGGR